MPAALCFIDNSVFPPSVRSVLLPPSNSRLSARSPGTAAPTYPVNRPTHAFRAIVFHPDHTVTHAQSPWSSPGIYKNGADPSVMKLPWGDGFVNVQEQP